MAEEELEFDKAIFILQNALAMAIKRLGGSITFTKKEMDEHLTLSMKRDGRKMFDITQSDTEMTITLLIN